MANKERKRLDDSSVNIVPWKKWGPYLSERQWGTVREDYSEHGTAWDYFLFYEYFHGDNGAGIGASHQTGWTGLVAKLIQMYGHINSELVLEVPRGAAQVYKKKEG